MGNITLMIVIGILLFIGLVIVIIEKIIKKKENRKPNYKAFFIIGICWLPLGISTGNYAFSVIGLVFMILGITHRKSWGNQPKWIELSPAEKKIKIALILFIALILILGVVVYFLAGN